MKGVHIFMAQGFEDMEALATRDVLVRGGVPVITVSITDEYIVQSSHGLDMMADTCWEDVEVMEPDTDAMDMMASRKRALRDCTPKREQYSSMAAISLSLKSSTCRLCLRSISRCF